MTVSEFITAITVVGLTITLLVAFFAWAFVKLFLLRWERTQSETIASQESEHNNNSTPNGINPTVEEKGLEYELKKILSEKLTPAEIYKKTFGIDISAKDEELLEIEQVDYSEAKYFGIPVTQIPRKELYKIIYNQALSHKRETAMRFELEEKLAEFEFNNK